MRAVYLEATDTAFVRLGGFGARVAYRRTPHRNIIVHFKADHTVAGLEFLQASRGVRLADVPLPNLAGVARALVDAGIKVIDWYDGAVPLATQR